MDDQELKEGSVEIVREGLDSVSEVMRFLQVARSTVYGLMDTGQLPYVKIGRARRIPRKAVIAFAASALRGGWKTSTH